jgi:hypothetical protein
MLISWIVPIVGPMIIDMLSPVGPPPDYFNAMYMQGYAQMQNDVPMDSDHRYHPTTPNVDRRLMDPKPLGPPEKFERGRHYKGHWYREGEGQCWTRREGRWEWNHVRCK